VRTGETSRFFPHSSAFFVSCQLVGAKHLEKHVSQLPIIYLPNASPVQLSVGRGEAFGEACLATTNNLSSKCFARTVVSCQ